MAAPSTTVNWALPRIEAIKSRKRVRKEAYLKVRVILIRFYNEILQKY